MARLILLAAAIWVLVWLLRRGLGASAADAPPRSAAPADLVACAHCGVLLPRSEARDAAGALYCSEAHARLGPRRP